MMGRVRCDEQERCIGWIEEKDMQTIPISVGHIDDAELALGCVAKNINIWLDAMTMHAEEGEVPPGFTTQLRLQLSEQAQNLIDRQRRLSEGRPTARR